MNISAAPPHPAAVSNIDRDSLHTLALAIVPLEHPMLRRARIVKNNRLVSVIEMYRDRESGSGQIEIDHAPQELGLPPGHPDIEVLRKLELMPSYDVYSLRVLLRAHGIDVNSREALKLSPEKTRELAVYMKAFTRPLLAQIYGTEDASISTFEDVVGMFSDPDVATARRKLTIMAASLGISLQDIPRFLEDYADIFLSLSYYRQCLDHITPIVEDFLSGTKELKKSYQMRTNMQLMTTCDELEAHFTALLTSVAGRLEAFNRQTRSMWDDLSAERFRKIENVIKTYHITMGGILCALTVKMDAWAEMFPQRHRGGPVRKADFIMSEMKPGMKRIREFEKRAPSMTDLN